MASKKQPEYKPMNRQLSPYLAQVIQDQLKKHDQHVFEVTNQRVASDSNTATGSYLHFPSQNIPKQCDILNVEGDTEADIEMAVPITIQPILRYAPGGPDSRLAEVPMVYPDSELWFNRSTSHRRIITSTQPGLLEYMILCQRNEWCKGKPWHIAPKGNRYSFKLLREDDIALPDMNRFEKLQAIFNLVTETLPDEAIRYIASYYYNDQKPTSIMKYRTRIMTDAEKKDTRTLDKLHSLVTSDRLKFYAQLTEAKRQGIIRYQAPTWFWESGKELTQISNVNKPMDGLIDYLSSNAGQTDRETLKLAMNKETVA